MEPGDHIMIDRGGWAHHGIYVGDNNVVHWRGEPIEKLTGVKTPVIVMQDLEEFGPMDKIVVIGYDVDIAILERDDVVSRALHKVGMTDYNLAHNNCEHFAIWCKTGLHESTQVDETLEWLAGQVHSLIT